MPCMDRFERQPRRRARARARPARDARAIAVEAASPFGWDRWVGERGAVIGMRTFGASGPGGRTSTRISASPPRPSSSRPAHCCEHLRGSTHGKRTPHRQRQRMAALVAAGTAPWLDQIRRGLITSGELARLRDEYSLRGVTSNPAIFEQAILGSSDYDDELRELRARGARRARALRAHRGRRPPGRRRRAAPGLRRARRRLRLVRGHARTSPTTPSARSRRRATTGRGSTART